MPTINQLPSTDTLEPDDLLPVYSSTNGDARKASVNTLAQLVADQVNELVVAPSDATPQAPTALGAPGIDIKYSRADHAHPSDAPDAATTTPVAPSPAGAIGASADYARADHSHPSDAPAPTNIVPTAPGPTGTIGASLTYARGDHSHPSDAPLGATATPLVDAVSGSAGVSAKFAREDHVHPLGASNTPFDGTPSAPTVSGAAGGSLLYARGDHSHPSDAPLAANVAPLNAGTASVGVSARYARQDHIHNSEVDNSIGSSTSRAPSQAAVLAYLMDKEQMSTAILSGGILAINAAPAKFDVSAITAVFIDNTDPLNPVSVTISAGPFTAVVVTNMASQPATYVGFTQAGTLVQQSSPFTSLQRRTIAVIGLIVHTNLTSITAVNQLSGSDLQAYNQLVDLMDAVGPLNISGNVYGANGANLNINKSSGILYKNGANYANSNIQPHNISLASATALTFRYRMSNSSEGADRTAIDPTQYENAGVLTAVSNNNFTIQRIYMFQSNLTRIQWGQAQYASMDAAIAAINTEAFTVESNMAANGVLRGYLVVKKEATNLQTTTDARFIAVPKFGGSIAGGSSVVPEPATATPLADSGAGAVGVSTKYAREDHVHPTSAGGGSVTTVSVVSANGLAGSVANPTTTPAITLSTTVNGIVKGNGSALSAAVAGDFPTLNQNTTGTAANVTGVVAVANGGTGLSSTPANGELDIGNGTGFTRTTLTAGANISITNGSGSITIASTGGGSFDPALTQSYGGASGNESLRILASGTTGTNFFQLQGGAGISPAMYSVGASANIGWDMRSKGTGDFDFRQDAGGNQYQFRVRGVSGAAVNYMEVSAAATGGVPSFTATGGDTNVNALFRTKGTGELRLRPNGTDGFAITSTASLTHTAGGTKITAAGNTVLRSYATGSLPSAATEGSGAIVRDSTTAQLKMSDGSTWAAVGGSGGGGAWTFLGEVVPSGGAAFSFLNSFDASQYSYYRLEMINLRGASSGCTINLQVAVGGSVQAANYRSALINEFTGSSAEWYTVTTVNALSATSATMGVTGSVLLHVAPGIGVRFTSNASYVSTLNEVTNETRHGNWLSAGVVSGVWLVLSTGSSSSAGSPSVRLYGLKKS